MHVVLNKQCFQHVLYYIALYFITVYTQVLKAFRTPGPTACFKDVIKAHDSVSYGQVQPVQLQQTSVSGKKKMLFSCICNLIMPKQNCNIFAVESPLG